MQCKNADVIVQYNVGKRDYVGVQAVSSFTSLLETCPYCLSFRGLKALFKLCYTTDYKFLGADTMHDFIKAQNLCLIPNKWLIRSRQHQPKSV